MLRDFSGVDLPSVGILELHGKFKSLRVKR
jgi:hypothetical protein